MKAANTASVLTAMAAVAALLFTGLSLQQNTAELGNRSREIDLAQGSQVTDRFTAAIAQLGDKSIEVRLGGIFALQRIMIDSPRDQTAIVKILSAYIRTHGKGAEKVAFTGAPARDVARVDVASAAVVIAGRDASRDSSEAVNNLDLITWSGARLPGADFPDPSSLDYVKLTGADLRRADLSAASLSHADFTEANLADASLLFADLVYAQLKNANLEGANIAESQLYGADLSRANLKNSLLEGAELHMCSLAGADLRGADLRDASIYDCDFSGANLRKVNLRNADLTRVDLTGAQLDGADFRGAKLKEVRLPENVKIRR
ncbi:pentapeptide repeat-containing protein [Streptomyces anulatus]|uniref:pentapeptide repeat-containing protein n=1 Tax=Streptomyces anulatus TaxID=1892 RepID=UPI00367F8A90